MVWRLDVISMATDCVGPRNTTYLVQRSESRGSFDDRRGALRCDKINSGRWISASLETDGMSVVGR